MTHLAIAPILIPFAAGIALILLRDARAGTQRALSVGATLAMLGAAIGLAAQTAGGALLVYRLGDWPAPVGIALLVDRTNALLVVLTALVALAAVIYAASGHDRAGARDFHALFQFQLMGVVGAFLTGDLFNLFVFFEILLISSYALLLHGSGVERVRAALPYVIVNLVGSAAFLIAVGTLYGVTGALNMADVARQMATLPPSDAGIALAGARTLVVVFAVKAALLPLGFWLPLVYGAASGPVAALFAILTKVGVFALIRADTLMFASGPLADRVMPGLTIAGALTLGFAAFGILAATRLRAVAAYAVVASVGTLLIAVDAGGRAGLAAALFYALHSTLGAAALFLLADAVAIKRGDAADDFDSPLRPSPWAPLAAASFVALIAAAGLPPLAGFAAKVLVLEAVRASALHWPALWATILGASLVSIVGFARGFSAVFWRTDTAPTAAPVPGGDGRRAAAIALLLLLLVGLSAAAGPVYRWCDLAAAQLLRPGAAIHAVSLDGDRP